MGEEDKERYEKAIEGQGYQGRYVLLMTMGAVEESMEETGWKEEAERLVEEADREKGEV